MLKANHRAWVEIDLGAIQSNVSQIRQLLASDTAFMAIVKADAYGHGAVGVSRAAVGAGASWLGVATIEEGIQLRKEGITVPILVLGALNTPAEIESVLEHRLQPTLGTYEQAELCESIAQGQGVVMPVHLKVDTGMSRLGMPWEEGIEFVQTVDRLPHLALNGLYSHLATADDSDRTQLILQHQRFQEIVDRLRALGIVPPLIHLSNTAATLAETALHYDLVRVGLGIYGYSPAPHLAEVLTLSPALTVKARIAQIKSIKQGTGVSYGHRFCAPREMKIATVSIGYADGLPRRLSDRVTFLLHGKRVQQIGTITMDQCMIDISLLPQVEIGDVVTILGDVPGTTAQDWANLLDTIAWEILCGFKRRLPRITKTASKTLPPSNSWEN